MPKAVVTGANGFVGAAVVKELVHHDYEVLAVVHKDHMDRLHDIPHVQCISCDLEEIASLPERAAGQKYDLFFHFAWTGSAGTLRGDAALQLQNVQWTVQAIEAAKNLGCHRFIGAGSIMEYEAVAAIKQPNAIGMGNIYGSGKLAAHIMGLAKAKELDIDFLWGVITNIYGPGESSPRLVNTTIQKCLHGEPPKFTSGTQNYDFIYIDDAAEAFRTIGEKGISNQEYVIGSSNAKPLKEFLLDMKNAIAPNLPFYFGDMPFSGISLPKKYFDCSITERDTGFKARVSFPEGCRRTADWWKCQMVRR